MALDDIFKALEEQADAEIEQLLQDARDQADAIAEQAADDADQARQERVGAAERQTRSKASQRVNAAKLESKKRVAAVKERAVSETFDSALVPLDNVRTRDSYPAIFRSLTEEALAGLEGDLVLHVDPADADLAARTIVELGVEAEVSTDLTTRGGVVVATNGGRIKRRNTLEDRLDKVRQADQAAVAELLFS